MYYSCIHRAAGGLALVGVTKFHSQARTSVNNIIKTANDASEIMHNATGALNEIKHDLEESNVGVEASQNLDSTADKFGAAAENIGKKARKDRHIINKALRLV